VSSLKERLAESHDLLQDKILSDVDMAGMLQEVKQGVTAALELSWQSLPKDSQYLGGLMTLFAPIPTSWPLLLAAAKDIPGLGNPAVACSHLVRMNLVEREDDTQDHYRMHRLVRSFFRSKVENVEDLSALRHGRRQALLPLCHTLSERCTKKQADAFAETAPHVDAMLNDGDHATEAYQALQRYYFALGLYQQALNWSEEAIPYSEVTHGPDSVQTAIFYKQAGEMALLVGRPSTARTHLNRARDLLQETPSPELAHALTLLAALQRDSNELEAAEATIQESLELCKTYYAPDSLEMVEAELTQATTRFVRLMVTHQGAPPHESLHTLERQVQKVLKVRDQHSSEDAGALAEVLNLLAKLNEANGEQYKALHI
jgi:tetratricopeptide (TPR) repeat protein